MSCRIITTASLDPSFLATLVTCSNGTASFCNHLKAGILPPGGANPDYGLYTFNAADTLGLWSSKSSGSGSVSVQIVADINAASINDDHRILSIGWVNNGDTFSEKVFIDGLGNIYSNSGLLKIGVIPAFTNSVGGYGLKSAGSTAVKFLSSKTNASGSNSFEMIADVNAVSLNAKHDILRIGWADNTDTFHQTHVFRDNELEMGLSSSAVLLGTEADGGSAVGVVLGSELEYSTAGAKLLSVTNAAQERAYVGHDGSWVYNIGDYGGYEQNYTLSALVTIMSGSNFLYTTASLQIPADCQVKAVSSRVITTIPSGALSWSLGVPGDLTRYANSLSCSAGITFSGMEQNGARYYPTASELIITTYGSCPVSVSDISGAIRITSHIRKIVPPTS